MPHGGKRPGAGAPRRNKNGLKNGFSSKDPSFLVWWHSLTPDQQEFARPLLKRSGWDGLPEDRGDADAEPEAVVVPFDRSAIQSSVSKSQQYIHTQRDTIKSNQVSSSNPYLSGTPEQAHREKALIATLVDYVFHGATAFVEKHREALEIMERCIAEFQDIETNHPEEVAWITSKGGYLRNRLHEAMVIKTGRMVQCPYCAYKQFILSLPELEEKAW